MTKPEKGTCILFVETGEAYIATGENLISFADSFYVPTQGGKVVGIMIEAAEILSNPTKLERIIYGIE